MSEPIAVLFVDDSEDDTVLLRRHLDRMKVPHVARHVDSGAGLAQALATRTWDVILCDYSMRDFDGPRALAMVQASGADSADTPFIIVSGAIGEEAAVASLRAGAHDFVLKDNLARLVPAIEREIAEARSRAEQRAMKARLEASEAALARSEKLRALGQMAAGISHDLKNLLNPLSLHLQLVARALEKGDADGAKASVVTMQSVVARGVQTVERLREYSRQDTDPHTARVNLNTITEEAVALARPRMSARGTQLGTIDVELGDAPEVRGSPSEVLSAIVNVIVNAVEAIPTTGRIVVATGNKDGVVFVSIKDDGPGMSPEVERRIFEPFFTTKGEEGTGLGLAMVYASMKRHSGAITVDTAPGRGAKFTLCFPLPPES